MNRKPEFACDAHGEFGTWILIEEPSAGAEFSVLKERPPNVKRPADVSLLPLSRAPSPNFADPSAQAENSALMRVSSKVFEDNPELSTTDLGWPVADCDKHPSGGTGCRFGFLIQGTPVVAQWFSPTGSKAVTQGQVWDVATDIDRRLRSLTEPHEPTAQPTSMLDLSPVH